MVKSVSKAIKKGYLSARHIKRTFSKKATPFAFPDAFAINQQLESSKPHNHHRKEGNSGNSRGNKDQ
jgi:hypothetical protein